MRLILLAGSNLLQNLNQLFTYFVFSDDLNKSHQLLRTTLVACCQSLCLLGIVVSEFTSEFSLILELGGKGLV